MEIYILPYVKQIGNGNSLNDLGNSNQASVTTYLGGDVVGSGREVQEEGDTGILWLTHVDVWQKPPQYCKAIILQLKRNFFKK